MTSGSINELKFTDIGRQSPEQRECSTDSKEKSRNGEGQGLGCINSAYSVSDDQDGERVPMDGVGTAGTNSLRGHIHFHGYDSDRRNKPFMRVKDDANMEDVWNVLYEDKDRGWRLPFPRLLISVTGSAKWYAKDPRLEQIIKHGLVNAAVCTGAWLISGGTATGVMKLVGEAVQDYNQSTGCQEDELVALGIASWGYVANRTELAKAETVRETFGWPVVYKMSDVSNKVKNPTKCAPLDHNHTHFLLVDDDTEGTAGGEITFRSMLEQFISTRVGTDTPATERQCSPTGGVNVPLVLVVVGGGVNTLKTVRESIMQGSPVVVVADSGRAANFISEFADTDLKTGVPGDALHAQMMRRAKELLEQGVPTEAHCLKAVEDLKLCLVNKNLLNIFHHGSGETVKDIERAVLSALLKANNSNVDCQLSLALAWNRCDIARQNIFTADNKKSWEGADLIKAMSDALVKNSWEFVQLYLDYGVDLKQFLTLGTLWKLYSKCMNKEYVSGLFVTRSYRMCSASREHQEAAMGKGPDVLPFISQVVVHLLEDPSFHFYSERHRVEIDTTTECVKETPRTFDDNEFEPDFAHPARELFLWAVLFNHRELAKLFWKKGMDHIGGALCASALLKRLSARAEMKEMLDLSEDLERHSVEWELRALSVLSECNSTDPARTHRVLVRELLHWATPADAPVKHTAGPDTAKPMVGRTTLLIMAESYEMMEFVGHSACQNTLSAIWKGNLAFYTSGWKILLCVFLPIFFPILKFTYRAHKCDTGGHAQVEGRPQQARGRQYWDGKLRSVKPTVCGSGPEDIGIRRAICYFYTAPVTKFYFNIVAYLVYLALFSYFMMVELDEGAPSFVEYLTWLWLATMIVEEGRQMLFRDQLSFKYRINNWIGDLWNRFDILVYAVFVVSIALRFILPVIGGGDFRWVRGFYSVTLVLSFFRLLQFFYAVKSMGPKVIMIQKMMTDVLLFMAVLSVFVLGFGVAYQANMSPEAAADWSLLGRVLYYPYFQIYGELFLDDLTDDVEGCVESGEEVPWLSEGEYVVCEEKSPIFLSVMLGVYMIVTNILLVNLLIAMFSYTFQQVQENSLKVWRYYRLSLVHEYSDRPALVPPFIIINHVFRVCRSFCCDPTAGWGKKFNAFRWELTTEEHRRLTLFEKNATEKYLMSSTQPTKEAGEIRTEAITKDDLERVTKEIVRRITTASSQLSMPSTDMTSDA